MTGAQVPSPVHSASHPVRESSDCVNHDTLFLTAYPPDVKMPPRSVLLKLEGDGREHAATTPIHVAATLAQPPHQHERLRSDEQAVKGTARPDEYTRPLSSSRRIFVPSGIGTCILVTKATIRLPPAGCGVA
jgi:hypothetical protein